MEKLVMKTAFKKPMVLTAALVAPFFMSAPASANTAPLVNQQAVQQLTTSVKETLAAYDALNTGDVSIARTKLDTALRTLESAVAKDPTLGIASTSAKAMHQELKTVRAKLNNSDRFAVKSELAQTLTRAGITLNS